MGIQQSVHGFPIPAVDLGAVCVYVFLSVTDRVKGELPLSHEAICLRDEEEGL